MNHPILSGILLGAAVVTAIVGSIGMALVGSAAARIHFVSATSLVAPIFVMVAVLADQGFSQAGIKTILIALVLVLEGPVVAHILGRAVHTYDRVADTRRKAVP